MIPKSGNRFLDKIMLQKNQSMIPKSGNRVLEKVMLQQKVDQDDGSTEHHPDPGDENGI